MNPQPRRLFESQNVFVGTITPSGNTVVERVTLAILSAFPEVSAHFSRTPVAGEQDPYPDTYNWEAMLTAAELLSHARPSVIVWNGSKGANIGLDLDRQLVDRITALTNTASTTSILAIDGVFREDSVTDYALVTPYPERYAEQTAATLARAGYRCVDSVAAGLKDNLSFASVPLDTIADMIRAAAKRKPQAILSCCTNFPGAAVVAEMEDELGIPIYDTTSIAVWKTLVLAGIDTRPGADWGRVFLR